MAKVVWALAARNDLREIHAYIARTSPRAADALVDRILTATERLADFPESGRRVPELDDDASREILVGEYRIVYATGGDAVWISLVVHGRRQLDPPDA